VPHLRRPSHADLPDYQDAQRQRADLCADQAEPDWACLSNPFIPEQELLVNLLYLPTLIALAIKYGPEISAAVSVIKQYTPMMLDMVKAISPVVQSVLGDAKPSTPDDIVSGVRQVLVAIGHPGLSADEADALANHLSQMS
jgi:hypothetical protein